MATNKLNNIKDMRAPCLDGMHIHGVKLDLKTEDNFQVVKELTKEAVNTFRENDILRTKVMNAYVRTGEKRIDRNPYNQLMTQKVTITLLNLQQRQAQLVFIIRQQVIE